MRRQSLCALFDANRTFPQLSGGSRSSHVNAPERLELDIDQAVGLMHDVGVQSAVNGELFGDACRLINEAVLFNWKQTGAFKGSRTHNSGIAWITLATDAAFLNGLLNLICNGCGVPKNQEAGSVLLCNLCMVLSEDLRSGSTVDTSKALQHLIYHAVGPLLIVISRSQLARLIPFAAHSLRYIVLASGACGSIDWFQSSLLLSHVTNALKTLFPPILLRPSLTHQEVLEHSPRLQRLISEEDIDLTAISSLFELAASCFGILFTSKVTHLATEEQRRFHELIQTGLVNLLFAMAVYWPCDSCRTNSIGEWDVASSLSSVNTSCQTLWNELDEEVMYTIEILLRCAFHVCSSSSESCRALFLHDEIFAQAVLQLVLSVTRCRYNTTPSLTTKCVIYAFRLLGQIFCLPNPHRSSSAADLHMILAMCDLSYRWLSTHMAWTLCAAEVSLTMANAVAYFTPVAAQLWLNPVGQLYLSHCFLPSLGVSFACSQSLRFIFNLLICDAVEPLKLSRLYSHTIGRAVLVRLDRLVRELISLTACLSNTRCASEWISECVSQLLDICALFECRSSATELMCEPTKSELPNLFRLIEELRKASSPQSADNSLQRFADIFNV